MISGKVPLFGLVAFQTVFVASMRGGTSLSREDGVENRLPRQVTPTCESVRLKIDADKKSYSGEVKIVLHMLDPTDHFDFHAEGLAIEKMSLTKEGRPVPFDYSRLTPDIVEIRSGDTLSRGSLELKIGFSNESDSTANSIYRMKDDGRGYVFSQFEADEAREAFPCWDEPDFKIPYKVTLIVPEGQLAVSNTKVEEDRAHDGWRTVVFKRTPPMPSYLLAIAVGPFDTVPIQGMSVPGRVITVKGRGFLAGEAVRTAPPILSALERYFGSRYPYDKLDLIALPEFWHGGMENPGAITFAERILLLDPETSSVGRKRTLASVMAHEMAHMWFGDLVTMSWWDDLWLNESFASWMGDKIVQEVFPEYGADVSQVRSAQRAMIMDARPSTHAMRESVSATDNLLLTADVLAYSKGEAILDMFEQWMGADRFRRGVLDYIKENEWGNATAEDLWASLSVAAGEDIAPAMSSFLDQAGVPLVSVDVAGDGEVRLRQERFTGYEADGNGKAVWRIPVTLKYGDSISVRSHRLLLDRPEEIVHLEGEGGIKWIFPDAGMHGYYRWVVPTEMMVNMAEQASAILDPRERVGMIGNLGALLDAGKIDGELYLSTLKRIADDPDPRVLSALLSALGKAESAFVTEDLEEAFSGYLRLVLRPALARFGMTPVEGEDEEVTRFRPGLIGCLGDEGRDKHLTEWADSLAREYLIDPAAVDPSLVDAVLYLSAIHGGEDLYREYKRRFESAQTPVDHSRFLYLVGSFRDSTLVEDALQYVLEGPLHNTELFTVLWAVSRSGKFDNRLFDWIMENYGVLTSRMPPEMAVRLAMFAGGCSEERLEKAVRFFAEPTHHVVGIDRRLDEISDQVHDCTGLREREGERVRHYLEGLQGVDNVGH